MKAITVWQPWASAIAAGVKGYETRTWATAYRGPVIVHAARTRRGLKALNRPPFAFLQSDLPFGAAIAVANLVDVIPTGQYALLPEKRIPSGQAPFGDYAPGRFAWKLENIRAFKRPIPAKGAQGFWRWTLKPILRFAGAETALAEAARKFNAVVVSDSCNRRLAEILGNRYSVVPELRRTKGDLEAGLFGLLEILLQNSVILSGGQADFIAREAANRYGVNIQRPEG